MEKVRDSAFTIENHVIIDSLALGRPNMSKV